MESTRVLIVDDSMTSRLLIRKRLSEDPRIAVVGEARDAYEARAKIKELDPQVLTLDVEMPGMNGLDFLEKLMRLRPMPVVMVSSETQKGSAAALEALSLGAVECLGKPVAGIGAGIYADLPDLVVSASNARLRGAAMRTPASPPPSYRWNGSYVLIGASTGGVDALETVLEGYPANCPPTLIVQHMPEAFLASFTARLSPRIAPVISLAEEGAVLRQGTVYLAPGGAFHLALAGRNSAACRLLSMEKRNGHRPSVEVLFDSALPVARRCVAVMLTGMGRDGAEAMVRLRHAGARCFAQDEASSVIFGMPRAALELGGAENAVSLNNVAPRILELSGENSSSPVRPPFEPRV